LANDATVEKYWKKFNTLYREPQRFYHNFYHISKLHFIFECFKPLIPHKQNFLLALWFHDAIYDPKKPDNEEQSAALFQQFASEAGLDKSQSDEVSKIIMATKKHTIAIEDFKEDGGYYDLITCQMFLDADVQVLAWEDMLYDDYAQRIRREYGHYGDKDYASGRIKVLEGFLDREKIFLTDYFEDAFEAAARENLKREIQNLKNKV